MVESVNSFLEVFVQEKDDGEPGISFTEWMLRVLESREGSLAEIRLVRAFVMERCEVGEGEVGSDEWWGLGEHLERFYGARAGRKRGDQVYYYVRPSDEEEANPLGAKEALISYARLLVSESLTERDLNSGVPETGLLWKLGKDQFSRGSILWFEASKKGWHG